MALFAFTSCNDKRSDYADGDGTGQLSLTCFTATGTDTKTETQFLYAVNIKNSEGEVVKSFEDHTQIPNRIELPVGVYTAEAITKGSEVVNAAFTPTYVGVNEFTIIRGETSSVLINTSLRDVKVTAVISDKILSFYRNCQLVITNNDGGILDFTESENRVGYFKNSGFITWTLTGKDMLDKPITFTSTIENTKPKEHYTLNFFLETVYTDGLEIISEKEDLNYSYHITVGMTGASEKVVSTTVDAYAKYAFVNGYWKSDVRPAGLAFEYRAENSEEWIKLGATDGTKEEDKTFVSAKITRLAPTTKYFFRVYSDEAVSAPVSFTTESVVDIQNLNFDTWILKGKNWYPNATASNLFWATGNEGTSTAGKGSVTTPVEGADAVSGKAVKMSSVYVNFLGGVVKTFAAGNIFTGYFKTDIGNPINSVKFGRPYIGRPSGMKGWFKYKSTTVNHNFAPSNKEYYEQFMGKEDSCHIYIKLENWGAEGIAPENRPSNVTTVGYGEFKTANLVTDWTEFNFDINYTRTDIKPTHAIVAASSSIHGGFFVGGEGSELFIDEFQLLWD